MTIEFDIYFSDLNERTQKRLLAELGATSSKEMNWDMDILPLATIMIENTEEEEEF